MDEVHRQVAAGVAVGEVRDAQFGGAGDVAGEDGLEREGEGGGAVAAAGSLAYCELLLPNVSACFLSVLASEVTVIDEAATAWRDCGDVSEVGGRIN
ncbi:hypothetical protein AB5J55_42770 [Streptomyces sp. R11]|uniref:Uncharacterized protein n=1 Tax=Streptomyces sp. R11 TaxID=3238625 RepID=A0AB39NB94_9ACTN